MTRFRAHVPCLRGMRRLQMKPDTATPGDGFPSSPYRRQTKAPANCMISG
ncbi:MAG: hypothetical protein ACR2JC_04645 [Chloroflexota bacterium]